MLPIWTYRKIGQGQPRVIIWTNYDWQESGSPQYYIHVHSFIKIDSLVPEMKTFEEFLSYGMAAILVMWPATCHWIFIYKIFLKMAK